MKNPETHQAQFCEQCPMKGEAHRALDRVHAVKLGGTLLHLSPEIPELNLGAYICLLMPIKIHPSQFDYLALQKKGVSLTKLFIFINKIFQLVKAPIQK